jgi:large subunit ribosomal protein L3
MKFILGRKVKMSQQHRPDGRVVSVTAVKIEPCVVTQVRSIDKDGYVALQIGAGKKKRVTKPLQGHLKDSYAEVREWRARPGQDLPSLNVGDKLDISQFTVGDNVTVVGTSKGHGFQGVVKRHGFGGQAKSHGHKDQLRMPGSIGSTQPQRVFKGMRMGGRMGGARITVKNLEVIAVNSEANEILISGAVPGAPRSIVEIQVK